MIARILVAGTHSGVGKTTVAVGLMAALARRGLRVQPFKVGPDFLDPTYHHAATGRLSAPLDSWMLGDEGVRRSFRRNTRDADIAVIEGMMGLHDGADAVSDSGSAARIAKLLDAPVLLVMDGSALARSAGALVLGYRLFDPEVHVAGVIANHVAGEGHAGFLAPAIAAGGAPLLGWLPPAPEAHIAERHLGLLPAEQRARLTELVQRLADLVEQHLDLDEILRLAQASAAEEPGLDDVLEPVTGKRVRIAVARDEAFCFYYPDNLALLEEAGAELVPFSPVRGEALPEGTRGVYLGGGYPELFAAALSGNRTLARELRDRARDGMPLFGECGGFMYLCQSLVDADGVEHRMAGLVPGRVRMMPELQAIGYREVRFAHDLPLGPAGTVARGHEFRWSRYEGPDNPDAPFGTERGSLGFSRDRLLASYVHLHLGSSPRLAAAFVDACR